MKKVIELLSSTKLATVLLFIFGAAIGYATFIENDYDTITAKVLIYNARWFEIVMILLVINFILHIPKYKLMSKEKLPVFIMHLALVVIIAGAGLTRYIGFEGSMPIREGETSNKMFSLEPYLQVFVADAEKQMGYMDPLYFTEITDNHFQSKVEFDGHEDIKISYVDFIPKAEETIEEHVSGGKDILEIVTNDANGRVTFYLSEGEMKRIGPAMLAFNNNSNPSAVQIVKTEDGFKLESPLEIATMKMPTMVKDTIAAKVSANLETMKLHMVKGGGQFVLKTIFKNAKKQLLKAKSEESELPDVLKVKVSYGGEEQIVDLYGGASRIPTFNRFQIGDLLIQMAYGAKTIELPFSIALNDFVLDRYPGSMSPSSYKSIITLLDENVGLRETKEIFMNNVMDYGGYRFFQSSYNPDEKGTILSVNNDEMGTKVTYLGYTLLGLGFILTFIYRGSRFQTVRKMIIQSRKKRMSKTLLMIFGLFSALSFAQPDTTDHSGHNHAPGEHHHHEAPVNHASSPLFNKALIKKDTSRVYVPISVEHSNKFGQLIVQTQEGRFQPVHSLAVDILHKISRKDFISVEGHKKLTPLQVMIDMMISPDFWKDQDIIYIKNVTLAKRMGLDKKMVSFNDFFTDKMEYKLQKFSEDAFRKKPIQQSSFDKEVIRLDERINVFMMAMRGSFLKIFPKPKSINNEWMIWTDSLANVPIGGQMEGESDSIVSLNQVSYSNLLVVYNMSLADAKQTKDYTLSDQVVESIAKLQRQFTSEDILPSESQLSLEAFYNKLNIFKTLERLYSIFAIFLLIFTFIDILVKDKTKNWFVFLVKAPMNFFMIALVFAFLFHTYGMGMRWYLAGHAPWSNGYEALLLVAWAGLLAGFLFSKFSKLTLAATALLAFFILMTAGHSSYDPQLTNLQPVLKSYWLVIHVAAITISYGFFGLAFILGIINMFIYIIRTPKSKKYLGSLAQELAHINELTISIGLALAAVGTFLGGVWANESWGRYWGWDAKETWALVIVLIYAMILHFRFIPKLKSAYAFSVASILSFGTVLMTFIGVNYYLSKGLHSYARGETPAFPMWAWVSIFIVLIIIVIAGIRYKQIEKKK